VNRRKIKINTKAIREIDRYPLVEVHWYDVCSDPSWQTIEACKKANFLLVLLKVTYYLKVKV